ncbi:hypothetical protein [Dokdonella sp.]|uniref:hypothetical protein n=1 Tax=Dokdonella sp. TaxID=2291710 RepID=UPI0035280CB1
MSPAPPSLKLNPSARISIGDVDTAPSFLIEAPIKGTSLSTVRVSAENFPDAHAFLCSVLIDGRKSAEINERTAAELCRIGVFAPEDAMPLSVAYRFPVRSSAPGISLSPLSSANAAEGQASLRMPAEWSDQELHFEPHHNGSVWAPVQVVTGSGTEGLQEFRHGEPSARKIALDEESTHAQFAREGYAILKNLIPAEHVTELGRFFQSLAEQGFLACHEDDGIRRFIAHNHPVARFWHDQLNERVSQLAGQRTKPSYSFVSLYLAGGDLYWHTDRPACEYTLALLLDYAPLDADARSAWALKLKDRAGKIHSLHQRVGEALIFKGRELMHGRDVLPNGHRSVSLLFHFVNEDYDGEMQ